MTLRASFLPSGICHHMQNRNEENTRLRPGKVSTWYLVRYDEFWSSIRIDKVLIALQNMVSSGFIDGLRKASNVPARP